MLRFVGAVESLDGIIALGLAVPLGWIADRYGRVRIMKQSLVVGFLGIAGMVWGIATNTKLLIFLAVPFMSSYNQNVQQGVQTLIGDHVPPGQQRTKVAESGRPGREELLAKKGRIVGGVGCPPNCRTSGKLRPFRTF